MSAVSRYDIVAGIVILLAGGLVVGAGLTGIALWIVRMAR
jgi:hypothetical protein